MLSMLLYALLIISLKLSFCEYVICEDTHESSGNKSSAIKKGRRIFENSLYIINTYSVSGYLARIEFIISVHSKNTSTRSGSNFLPERSLIS